MSTKIYVGGLASETTENELNELFTGYGAVDSVAVIMDRSGKSKGFGFVEMVGSEEAQKAITTLHGKDFGGRKLTINQARPTGDRR